MRDTIVGGLKSVGWLFLFAAFSALVYLVRAFAWLAYPKARRTRRRREDLLIYRGDFQPRAGSSKPASENLARL